MSDVVRRGTIIIDLLQGKTEIKAPDLRDLLTQLERELELTKQTEQAQRDLNEARQSGFRIIDTKPTLPPGIAEQLPPEWGGTAKPGGAGAGLNAQADAAEKAAEETKKATEELDRWAKGIENIGQSAMPQIDRWAEGMKRIAEQTAAAGAAGDAEMAKLAAQSDAAGRALLGAAEGGFRLARGMVLLGTSGDESLQKMVRGLAMVQAGFDLFKGAQKIVENVEKAKVALAAATALNTAATTAETAAKTANAAASTTMAAADYAAAAAKKAAAAATNPVVLGLVALGAAVMTVVEAYDYFVESEEELAEKQRNHAEMAAILVARERERIELAREVSDMQRETMSDAEKADSMAAAARGNLVEGMVAVSLRAKNDGFSGAEREGRLGARQNFQDSARDLKEEKQLRQQILNEQIKQKDQQIEAIKNQEQLVEASRKQLEAEKEKVTTFQAQMGQLTQQQQNRLREIRDKLLAGQDISKFEERFLKERGGEGGAGVVREREAARGKAAGFDENFYAGIPGGERMADDLKSAAKELAEAAKKLAELTNGQTAAAKIAEIEAEKDQLRANFQDFMKEWNAQWAQLIELIAANNKRLDDLGNAGLANAGR